MNKGWPLQEYLREDREEKKIIIFLISKFDRKTYMLANSVQDLLRSLNLLQVKHGCESESLPQLQRSH